MEEFIKAMQHDNDNNNNIKIESDESSRSTICISNLSDSLKEKDLRNLFEDCGKIEICIIKLKFGKGRVCYIKFSTNDNAETALLLDGQMLDGKPLQITVVNDCFVENYKQDIENYNNDQEKKSNQLEDDEEQGNKELSPEPFSNRWVFDKITSDNTEDVDDTDNGESYSSSDDDAPIMAINKDNKHNPTQRRRYQYLPATMAFDHNEDENAKENDEKKNKNALAATMAIEDDADEFQSDINVNNTNSDEAETELGAIPATMEILSDDDAPIMAINKNKKRNITDNDECEDMDKDRNRERERERERHWEDYDSTDNDGSDNEDGNRREKSSSFDDGRSIDGRKWLAEAARRPSRDRSRSRSYTRSRSGSSSHSRGSPRSRSRSVSFSPTNRIPHGTNSEMHQLSIHHSSNGTNSNINNHTNTNNNPNNYNSNNDNPYMPPQPSSSHHRSRHNRDSHTNDESPQESTYANDGGYNDESCSSSEDELLFEVNDNDDNYTTPNDEYSEYETMEAEATKSPLKSQELLEELLIHGYVRVNKKTKRRLPKDILDLIIKWYHTDSYFALIGDKCTLNPLKTIVTYSGFISHEWWTDRAAGEAEKEPNCCYHSIIMPSISERDIEYVYKLKIKELTDIICIGIDSTNGEYINDDFTNQKLTYNYSYYSEAGTGYCHENACSEANKKKYPYHGWTYGHPYGEGDIITMYYNPYHSTVQFELDSPNCKQKFQTMNVFQKMGLQYRLCIYMGDCGRQSIKLLDYKVIGDVDQDESDQEENESVDGQIAVAAQQLDNGSVYASTPRGLSADEWIDEEEIEESENETASSKDHQDENIKENQVAFEDLFAELFGDMPNDGNISFASNNCDAWVSQQVHFFNVNDDNNNANIKTHYKNQDGNEVEIDIEERGNNVTVGGLNIAHGSIVRLNYNETNTTIDACVVSVKKHQLSAVTFIDGKRKRIWYKELRQGKINIVSATTDKWNCGNNNAWDYKINNFGDNVKDLFTFGANYRGIDLEAEKILNRVRNDKSIRFGVKDNNDEMETYVPYNYICKGCDKVGDHWIMDCTELRQRFNK